MMKVHSPKKTSSSGFKAAPRVQHVSPPRRTVHVKTMRSSPAHTAKMKVSHPRNSTSAQKPTTARRASHHIHHKAASGRLLAEKEALRRKAVPKAWAAERKLANYLYDRKGMPKWAGNNNQQFMTRRWKPSQIRELIRDGKVKGFEGHHIRSVSRLLKGQRSDLISDPRNIAFLTRREHLDVHRKAGTNPSPFKNPTTGRLIDRHKLLKNAQRSLTTKKKS